MACRFSPSQTWLNGQRWSSKGTLDGTSTRNPWFLLFTINFLGVPVVFGKPTEMSYQNVPSFQSTWLQILHHLHLGALKNYIFDFGKTKHLAKLQLQHVYTIYIYIETTANNSYQKSATSVSHSGPGAGLDIVGMTMSMCQASLSMGGGGGKLLLACFEKVLPWCSRGTFRTVEKTCYVIPPAHRGEMNKVFNF